MQGYIKDHRKELNSDIWLMPPLYHRVWQYLKYMVNHHDQRIPMKDGTMFKVEKGQHLTSVRKLAKSVGYYEGLSWKEPNPKTIRTILEWLKKQEMITVNNGRGNGQYTLITLPQWEKYQEKDNEGNRTETARDQYADTNKNDQECLKNDLEVVVGARASEESKLPETEIKTADYLLDYFMLKREKPGTPPKVSDYPHVKKVISAGVPAKEAVQGINQSFAEFIPKYDGDEITSFAYCKKVILNNHYRNKARKEAKHERHTGRDGRSDPDEYEELSL
jgi:hypothetical protein